MMMAAIIMRPWIKLMRNIVQVECFILADDVLIIANGQLMITHFVQALNLTHAYLQAMGARIAPDKSYNFASTKVATKLLNDTLWPEINDNIEVVEDFRYLGAHLISGQTLRSKTLHSRWDKAVQQLRRLKYTPATIEAKAKTILSKTYAVAFYGIEAAEIATDKVNHLAAVVIDVFRSRNDMHNNDWFFSSFFGDKRDLDPNYRSSPEEPSKSAVPPAKRRSRRSSLKTSSSYTSSTAASTHHLGTTITTTTTNHPPPFRQIITRE